MEEKERSSNICFLVSHQIISKKTEDTSIFCQQLKHKSWQASVFVKSVEESLF